MNRSRGQGTEGPARNSFDAEFLQQTVQAVVAAVTAATKVTDVPIVQASTAIGVDSTSAAANTVAGGQDLEASVAVPNPSVQQTGNAQVVAEGIENAEKGKENEDQSPL